MVPPANQLLSPFRVMNLKSVFSSLDRELKQV